MQNLLFLHIRSSLCLFLLLIFSKQSLLAQTNKTLLFKHLTQENGLSDPTVRALHLDKDGFLWIGTENGLNRFDGTNCIAYKKQSAKNNTSPGNYITKIIEDKDGSLIIGSQSNLVKYDKKTDAFSLYRFKLDKLKQNYYSFPFYIDNQDVLWVYLAGEVYKYHAKADKLVKITDYSNGFQFVNKPFYQELKQFISRGVKGIYINKIQGGREISATDFFMSAEKSHVVSHIEDVYSQSDSTLWLVGDKGLMELNPKTKNFKIFELFNDKKFTGTAVAKYPGKPWLLVGTNGSGLLLFDLSARKFIRQFKHSASDPNSISANYIRRILIDKKNNLFLSVDKYGLDYTNLDQVIFPRYVSKEESPDNDITSILNYSNLEVWCGTKSSGIKVYTADLSRLARTELTGIGVNKLIKLKDQNVLLESNNGEYYLFTAKNKNFKRLTVSFSNQFKGKANVHQFIQFDKDTLLAATEFGVAKVTITENGLIFFDLISEVNRSLPWNNVQQVIKLTDEKFLVQTYYTALYLYSFKNNKFSYVKEVGRVPFATNSCLMLGNDLFLATSSGLLKFNVGGSRTKEITLIDANCSSLVADKNGNLWVGTNNGLYFYDTRTQKSIRYTVADGLQSMVFNVGSVATLPNNKIAVGGLNGINIINPDNATQFKSGSCPQIVSLKVNDKVYKSADNALSTSLLNLSHNQNTITIGYSSMDFVNPAQREITYKMTGYENRAVTTKGNGELRFPNMPSGNYTFELTDVLSKNKTVISIHINAPFWQKWWFITVACITMILLGIIILILYLRWLKHMQALQLRQMISFQKDDRKRIADDLHDDLGLKLSSLKHYLLAGDINKMISGGELRSLSVQYIDQALQVLRNTLINLSPKTLDENGLIPALQDLANTINRLGIIEIHIDNVGFSAILKNAQQYAIYRICQELINNTVKHAEAKNIYISIVNRDDKFILLYEDDGKGFDYPAVKRGYGLSNIEAHIQAIKANIDIDTQPGRGVAATITIYLKQKNKPKTDG